MNISTFLDFDTIRRVVNMAIAFALDNNGQFKELFWNFMFGFGPEVCIHTLFFKELSLPLSFSEPSV